MQGMQTSDSKDLLEDHKKQALEAKEYNQKHMPDRDTLLIIRSHLTEENYLEYEKGTKDFKSFIAYMKHKHKYDDSLIVYYQIKTLVNLNSTCTAFNGAIPLKEIIKFCKKLPHDMKNKVLQIGIQNINQSYDCPEWVQETLYKTKNKDNYANNCICSILIQAEANPDTTYYETDKKSLKINNFSVLSQATVHNIPSLVTVALAYKANPNKDINGTPIFFYAKTCEIAEIFCKYRTIYRWEESKENTVIWHALNKDYSCELLALYLIYFNQPRHQNSLWENNKTILHTLIDLLPGYWKPSDKEFFTEQFLKKSESLLSILPEHVQKHIIKYNFIPYLKKHFNDIYESCFIDTYKDALKVFQIKAIALFESYGCPTKDALFDTLDYKTKDLRYDQTSGFKLDTDNLKLDADIKTALLLSTAEFEAKEEEKIYEIITQEEKIALTGILIETIKKQDIQKIGSQLQIGLVDINQQDKIGNTPLIWATIHKNYKIVRMLLDYGADPNISSLIGRTALDIAMEGGDDEIATLLIDVSDF